MPVKNKPYVDSPQMPNPPARTRPPKQAIPTTVTPMPIFRFLLTAEILSPS
jgi:hypothetical protein